MGKMSDHEPSKQVNDVTAIRRPTIEGWEPQHLLVDLMDLRDLAFQRKMYGPFDVLLAPAWDSYIKAIYWVTAVQVGDVELERVANLMAKTFNTDPAEELARMKDQQSKQVDGKNISNMSLKERILHLDGLADVMLDDSLTGYDAALRLLEDNTITDDGQIVSHVVAGKIVRAES